MATKAFTILVDESVLLGITASRLAFNKAQPQLVPGLEMGSDPIPNPALFASDEDYVQQRWGVDAANSYYTSMQDKFRIPTGEWLQRWTPEERKAARSIGAGKVAAVPADTVALIEAWLDQLDANPVVNVTDAVVTQGVPQVVGLLVQLGVIAAADADARIAVITAMNI